MNDLQFLNYVPVTGEKYLGIATIRWLGKIILRFKIMESLDGRGLWIAGGSAKVGKKHDGTDNYEEWAQIDSSYDKGLIKDFVLMSIDPILKQSRASVFGSQPAQPMQGQGYSQPAQQGGYSAPSQPMPDYNPSQDSMDYGNPPF